MTLAVLVSADRRRIVHASAVWGMRFAPSFSADGGRAAWLALDPGQATATVVTVRLDAAEPTMERSKTLVFGVNELEPELRLSPDGASVTVHRKDQTVVYRLSDGQVMR